MTNPVIHPKAIVLIDRALRPLLESGSRIEDVQLFVSANADIAAYEMIQTGLGKLRVKPECLVPKGVAYLMEDPVRRNRGFAWVNRTNKSK
ncbi:hypothetical protein B2I21_07375 [Chryseobacterium mucoviscidosis]|nr:hypothetical protein B2I21_07375 [Chryseobacterium mucoviscidosis]